MPESENARLSLLVVLSRVCIFGIAVGRSKCSCLSFRFKDSCLCIEDPP